MQCHIPAVILELLARTARAWLIAPDLRRLTTKYSARTDIGGTSLSLLLKQVIELTGSGYHIHDPDPEMRTYDEPVSPELRQDLITHMIAGARQLYDLFEEQRQTGASDVSSGGTFRRQTPKVGRNQPCPCGSGKKFKNCCGKMTLH